MLDALKKTLKENEVLTEEVKEIKTFILEELDATEEAFMDRLDEGYEITDIEELVEEADELIQEMEADAEGLEENFDDLDGEVVVESDDDDDDDFDEDPDDDYDDDYDDDEYEEIEVDEDFDFELSAEDLEFDPEMND